MRSLSKSLLKSLVPNRGMRVPILRGPFRGARIWMVPQDNLRKMFGLYEHELNDWLERVLPRVTTVVDVGANNGYFAFGCAAAFLRLEKPGSVIAFEPDQVSCEQMRLSGVWLENNGISVSIRQSFVGKTEGPNVTTLNTLAMEDDGVRSKMPTLIKIDVEGAEVDVLDAASDWITPNNFFLIEVHRREYLKHITDQFAASGLPLVQQDQRPLPFLGRENRRVENWWLVTALD